MVFRPSLQHHVVVQLMSSSPITQFIMASSESKRRRVVKVAGQSVGFTVGPGQWVASLMSAAKEASRPTIICIDPVRMKMLVSARRMVRIGILKERDGLAVGLLVCAVE